MNTTERLHFDFSLSRIGEGNGNPLQYSCLENPRDGRTWWAVVCGVAQSWTRLKWLSSSSSSVYSGYYISFSETWLICVLLLGILLMLTIPNINLYFPLIIFTCKHLLTRGFFPTYIVFPSYSKDTQSFRCVSYRTLRTFGSWYFYMIITVIIFQINVSNLQS